MKEVSPLLIAPCGMNCALCLGFQREKNHCNGCRNEENIKYKTKGCANCIIKNCKLLKEIPSGFCYDCLKFPCTRLKQLDKRYRTRYNMSMLENLDHIKTKGLQKFIEKENIKWKCHNCGELRCVHREYCLKCEGKNN